MTLTLKLFRREPAITRFDQLFTPYHKSSDGIARPTGSGLRHDFSKLHPAHGKLTWLRVLCLIQYCALLTLGFPKTPSHKDLVCNKHKLVGSFFNRHAVIVHTNSTSNNSKLLNIKVTANIGEYYSPLDTKLVWRLRLLVSIWFQVYFNALMGLLFTFPSRYSSLSITKRIQPYRLVPAVSLKVFFSRGTQDHKQERYFVFAYRAVTVYSSASQQIRLTKYFITFLEIYVYVLLPLQVNLQVWAHPFSLAATQGIPRTFQFGS